MISWIQNTFQHHFRVIFAVLLALTIISFVFTIGASPGLGRAERQAMTRPFFGVNLGSAEGAQAVSGDAQLSAFLQTGYRGLDQDQLQQYALHRYASLALARQLHLPQPSKSDLADYLKTLPAFAGQDGQFDPQAYTRFRDNLKSNSGLREAEVGRVLADDYRVNRIQKLLAGPGYVLPYDVQQQLLRAETSWVLSTATVDYASYQPAIQPSETELGQYFANNAFRYQIPPRFSGGYVEFPLTPYLSQINVSEEEAQAYFASNAARFASLAPQVEGKPAATPEFAAIKSQVIAVLRADRARQLALKAAADLTVVLYESKVTPASAPALLAARQLTIKPLAPFTREQGPAEFGGSPEIAEQVFKLGEDRCFSDAFPSPAGAVILLWRETLPARDPQLTEVRDRVTADYIENEKRKRFVEVGRQIKRTLEAQLKAGEAFDKAASTAASTAGVKIEAKTIPPFSLRQPPANLDRAVYGTLENLTKGSLSDMVIQADKGVIVYASDKKTPPLQADSPAYLASKTQLAQMTGSLTASGMIRELVTNELKKSEPARP